MKENGTLRCRRGFTLIEALIVVAIVAIMAVVTVPYLSGFMQNRALKTAARDLQGDIFEMRERSLSNGRWHQISFAGNKYSMAECSDDTSPCGTYNASYLTKTPAEFKTGMSMSYAISGGGNSLQFDSRGFVRPIGVNVITLTNSIASTATVTINQNGRTSVDWDLK
jgi:prepilin-type N-terminal cleavage/methylation domain-containing protein